VQPIHIDCGNFLASREKRRLLICPSRAAETNAAAKSITGVG
jgi:hypothetical protein